MNDPGIQILVGGVLLFLAAASAVTCFLWNRCPGGEKSPVLVNLASRIKAWWAMVLVFAVAVLIEPAGTILLFATLSFLAMREFITLTPTRPADYKALGTAFFLVIPLNYLLIWTGQYGFYAVFVPVWVLAFIPLLSAIGNDTRNFLQRSSEIQWGILICIYFLSHVPALLILEIPGYGGSTSKLLLFFVIVVQASDVLQYVWGKALGRHKIVPALSPSKTWEGFLGGVLSASLLGSMLWWATPFLWWQAGILSLLICLFGFWGGLVMSAIKRDRGIKDYGNLLGGHGGILDRLDSICFSAPVFFHLVRHFFL